MLYYLFIYLTKYVSGLNLFRYITSRAAAAAVTALIISLIFGPIFLRLLHRFQVKEKIRVVVNRVGLENGQISMKKAQETIGREIFKQIPNDYRIMAEVRNNGVPLVEGAPRSSLTQSILELASALDGSIESSDSAEAGASVSRWLSFWPALAKAKGKE